MFGFLFGRKKQKNYLQLEIRFHKEANLFGEHGTIVVSHVKQGLVEKPVRFVFVGIATPPKMDLNLMAYIWEEAQCQGYIPHHVEFYGKENEVIDTVSSRNFDPVINKEKNIFAPETQTVLSAFTKHTEINFPMKVGSGSSNTDSTMVSNFQKKKG